MSKWHGGVSLSCSKVCPHAKGRVEAVVLSIEVRVQALHPHSLGSHSDPASVSVALGKL